jgi:hypothetical protein
MKNKTEAEKETLYRKAIAKYLQGCNPEKRRAIAEQAVILALHGKPEGYKPTEDELKDTMELAIHQERIRDWDIAHPRKKKDNP